MRGAAETAGHGRLGAMLCAGLLALGGACGSDSGKQAKPAVDAGSPCVSPGVTANGCFCSTEQPAGLRKCVASTLIWTQCVCPPPVKADKCIEGQPVICNPCHGETTGRMTTCLHDGTFDCACASAGGDLDAG
jgi:hypothetical protein